MKVQIFQVDAFTNEKFKGNPAGVILAAAPLSVEKMQAIARELNNTESAFVFAPEGSDHDISVRFFTPTTEIAMCGHNTIALHAVRAIEKICKAGSYVQKTKAGLVNVEIRRSDDKFLITMAQKNPLFDAPLSKLQTGPLLDALNLTTDALHPDLPVQVVSTGNRKLLVPLRSRHILNHLSFSLAALKQLAKTFDCTGYYVFVVEEKNNRTCSYGRMFAPQIGIDEDPVTGMAIAPLGAYLAKHGAIIGTGPLFSFDAKQGEAMGRPGTAYVEVDSASSEIKVSGEAVIVFKSDMEI